jgi:methyltransferase (TIGR00027 family)
MRAEPSRTAIAVAVARGQHRLLDDPPWVLDDPFALVLVGPRWPEVAARSATRWAPQERTRMRGSFLLRSRYAEDRLDAAKLAQYVQLGAGLDSFAWRRPEALRQLTLFEVDHPASQAWKLERVESLGLPRSERHVFVPVDFETQSLSDQLLAAGWDPALPTFWSWLGVTMYLTREAIAATLGVVAAGAAGSEVVFSYSLDVGDPTGARARLEAAVAEQGEPFRSRFSESQVEELVGSCGLEVAEHPGYEEQVARYFSGRCDGLVPTAGARLLAARRR